MSAIRILLADDHKLFRDGLKVLLSNEKEVLVVGEASNGMEVIELAEKLSPDVIVMDMSMPKISGSDATRILLKEDKNTKVILLSANIDEVSIKTALKAGVKTYLHKDVSIDVLLKAIRLIHAGNDYISDIVSGTLYKSFLESIQNPGGNESEIKALTYRETEIVRLFAEGHSYKEIAGKLNISARTVESHKRRIMTKLKLDSTTELVKYAIKNSLINA